MPKKILIVDDEPDIILVVKGRLTAAGYDVVTAEDGQDGLNKAKKESPDLIILDVMMPKMDGYKVCGLLKADNRYNKIPVLMLTARVEENDLQTSKDVGADGYINKPFNHEEVLAKVKELLGES
ncbi:MAG: response regulator [Candidatus Omnitrophica bacterium]|nr:response regulator [Candidatus Omnitrophota bacterium]